MLADAVSSVEASAFSAPEAPTTNNNNIFALAAAAPQGQFSLLDLELLHHFLTKGYHSIARKNTHEVWQVHIPRLAYTREFLMRGMIALGALHMAAEEEPPPSKTSDLISTAATSMNFGLPVLQQLVETLDLNDKDDCGAAAAYTALVPIYGLSMPSVEHFTSVRLGLKRPDDPFQRPLEQLFDNFELVRGTAHIYRNVWSTVSQSDLRPITNVDVFRTLADIDKEYSKLMDRWKRHDEGIEGAGFQNDFDRPRQLILERCKDIKRWVDEKLEYMEEIQATCAHSQDCLSHLVVRIIMPESTLSRGFVMAWPAILEPLYMRLLREHFAPALSLLAIFALLFSEGAWITRGWRGWILGALMKLRSEREHAGENINNVWWDTVEWADRLAKDFPVFLDKTLTDEGLC